MFRFNLSESNPKPLPFTKHYASFIKAGKNEHIEQLFEKGLVFRKTLQYFRKLASKNLQRDPHDGAAFIKQVKGFSLTSYIQPFPK